DFDEVGATSSVIANVDAAGVATAQRPPGRERYSGGGFRLFVLRKADDNLVFPIFLVAIAIAVADELVGTNDLGHAEDGGIPARAGDAYGELAAWQKLLDQHGLLITLKKIRGHARERRGVVYSGVLIDSLSGTFRYRLQEKRVREIDRSGVADRFDDREI